jgi:hypothetical protein
MPIVVNHLHPRHPMPREILEKAQDAVRSVVDASVPRRSCRQG